MRIVEQLSLVRIQPYQSSFDPAIPRTMRYSPSFHRSIRAFSADLPTEKEVLKALVFQRFLTFISILLFPQHNEV